MCGARVRHPLHAQGRRHGPRSQYRAGGACSVRRQAVPPPRVRAGCALRDPVPALQGAAGMKGKYLLYVEDKVDKQLGRESGGEGGVQERKIEVGGRIVKKKKI